MNRRPKKITVHSEPLEKIMYSTFELRTLLSEIVRHSIMLDVLAKGRGKRNPTLYAVVMLFILINQTVQAEQVPPVNDILKKVETLQKINSDAQAKVVLTEQKAGQGVKVINADYYRRDFDNSFLIIMTAPESEKGNGYLRKGDNFWMYRKNTRTFQHIGRSESIGGSDVRGGDFEQRSLTDLYAPDEDSTGAEIIREEMLGRIPVYRFEVKAKVSDVSYPRKVYWTRRDNNLPLKEESYTMSRVLMQTTYYLKYVEIKGRYVPVKQVYIDEFEKGNKTIAELSDISIDTLSSDLFTKAYLENLSK